MARQEHQSLRQGLVGAWCPSLDASGLSLIDRSGRGNHGSHTGAFAAQNSGVGVGVSGTQFVTLGPSRSLYPSLTSITFSVWVLFRSFQNAQNELLETITDESSTNNYNISCAVTSAGKINFYVYGTSVGNQSAYAGTGIHTLALNTWYQLSFVFLGGQRQQGYVNGNLDGSVASPVSTITASATNGPVVMSRAATQFGSRFCNAIFDDARIYNRALTAPEIRLLASRRGIGLQPLPDRAAGLPRKLSVNVGGTWRAADAYVNVGSEWRLGIPSVNVAGVWK